MSPSKGRSVKPRAGRTAMDGVSHENLAEQEPSARAIPNSTPLEYAGADEDIEDAETQSNALMSTPQAGTSSNTLFGTADFSLPATRPARKDYFDSILVDSPSSQSDALNRLRLATTRNSAIAETASRLEEAEDIDYEEASEENAEGDREEVQVEDPPSEPRNDESGKGHPTVGGLRVCRRSDRIRAQLRDARESSPSTALSAVSSSNRIQKKRNRSLKKTSKVIQPPLRRSARLAKPLDVFHKYPDLPPELQFMIWEAAIEPRLVYICNRYSTLDHSRTFGIQNKIPPWFMACRKSAYIAMRFYQKLFAQENISTNSLWTFPVRTQDVGTLFDIVIFEPCHNGCRACYCAQQYNEDDRARVQRLAVQIDSPHLPAISEPGWVTISRAWPNVTTLFMMKPAVRGLNQGDKAMIRIKEGDHELALRKLFEAWKKGAGQNQTLTTLEFVRVVQQEPATTNIKDRYQSVEDRKTGLVEDIILG
ncbi:hypothetical protein F4680DRAFT_400875 [Xylaria scruposa]|nr:hypothetical protein F4680DRAFT_400875 [Xylaria scruposa]